MNSTSGRRLVQVLAMLMVGKGVFIALRPTDYYELWRCRGCDRMIDTIEMHPNAIRGLGALAAATGLWLGLRQMD